MKKSTSSLADVFAARSATKLEATTEPEPDAGTDDENLVKVSNASNTEKLAEVSSDLADPEPTGAGEFVKVRNAMEDAPASTRRPVGRPGGKGKKVAPGFIQATAYIPVELHKKAMEAAAATRYGPPEERRDFSEIVAEALRAYFQQSEKPEG